VLRLVLLLPSLTPNSVHVTPTHKIVILSIKKLRLQVSNQAYGVEKSKIAPLPGLGRGLLVFAGALDEYPAGIFSVVLSTVAWTPILGS
jgi:hypothetical protein